QALRRHRASARIDSGEVLAVEAEMGPVLARQHGVGSRAGRDQNGPRRKLRDAAVGALQADRGGMTRLVDMDLRRRQALGEANAFLKRLLDLLVVQGVARRIDEPAAIGDGYAAPGIQ